VSAIDLSVIVERAHALGLKAAIENSSAVGPWVYISSDDFVISVFSAGGNHIITPHAQLTAPETHAELAARLVKISHEAATVFSLIMEGFVAARAVLTSFPSEEIPF